jgi:hypothetical protein
MRTAFALAFAFFFTASPAVSEELTIDGTSQETFEESIRLMTEDLNEEDVQAFADGMMNMILTEYPPAKGQDGFSILLFGAEAVKAAPRTLDGRSRAEILERGRSLADKQAASSSEAASADNSAQVSVLECLRKAVSVQDVTVEQGDYSRILNVEIANHLPWPIAGIRFHYEVRTEGRAVPWAEANVPLGIDGGIEPGEVRTVGTTLFISDEASEPFTTTVTISDVADQDKRQLINDVRVSGWSEQPSTRSCDETNLVSATKLVAAAKGDEELAVDDLKDEFLLAVQRCWNLPASLRNVRDISIVAGVEFTASGAVISDSLQLINPNPAPDEDYERLFQATRRALLRCGPFTNSSPGGIDQWQSIEVVAEPDGVVSWSRVGSPSR